MRKNISGQVVGAQMIDATTGAAFTGPVTVAVTGDGGTQATGSVGSGACTHEGNGFHTYAPAQAETNSNHVAFTFIGTGAVPATVQIYPVAYDPSDTVRLGLTALPNVASGSAGAIVTSGTGTAQLSVSSGLVTLAGVTHTGATIPTVTTTGTATAVATVNGLAANVITATSIASDAITAAKIADGAIDAATFAAGAINAAALGADAITAAKLAADAVAEIQSGLSTLTTGQVNAEVLDVLATDTFAEPGATVAATSSLKDKIGWLFVLARNKMTQTGSTTTLRNDADSASIATAGISEDGTTFTRAEWS